MRLRAALATLLTAAFLLGGAGMASADEVAAVPTYDALGAVHRVPSKHRQVILWFAARATPAGYAEGEPVTWKVREVGSSFVVDYVWQQHAGESFRWFANFGRGPHAVKIWRNGVRVRTYTIGHQRA